MRYQKTLLLILAFLILACGEKKEKPELETKSEKIELAIPNSESELESEINQDFSMSAKSFVQEVLKENLRTHSFDTVDLKKIKHLRIFSTDGLDKIEAYSNKNYPKKSKPSYYEHFTLFVVTYKNSKSAEIAFNRIKSDLEYSFSDFSELSEELAERVKLLTIGAKPGGLITQNGLQVFSLVETCRDSPIDGNWADYENMFIDYITEEGKEIIILNAYCGSNKYMEERKKASSQQNL